MLRAQIPVTNLGLRSIANELRSVLISMWTGVWCRDKRYLYIALCQESCIAPIIEVLRLIGALRDRLPGSVPEWGGVVRLLEYDVRVWSSDFLGFIGGSILKSKMLIYTALTLPFSRRFRVSIHSLGGLRVVNGKGEGIADVC